MGAITVGLNHLEHSLENAFDGAEACCNGFEIRQNQKIKELLRGEITESEFISWHEAQCEGAKFGLAFMPVGGGVGFLSIAKYLRYKNASGIGIDFGKFRLDWHKIRLGGKKTGKDYNLPHIDIPGTTKHWPWHQIDKWWRGVK